MTDVDKIVFLHWTRIENVNLFPKVLKLSTYQYDVFDCIFMAGVDVLNTTQNKIG